MLHSLFDDWDWTNFIAITVAFWLGYWQHVREARRAEKKQFPYGYNCLLCDTKFRGNNLKWITQLGDEHQKKFHPEEDC